MSTTNPIEGKVREILGELIDYTETDLSNEVVRQLVQLVGDEKSKSYGLGFVDGERRMKSARMW